MFDFFKVLADEVAGGTTPTPDAGAGSGAGANPGNNPWMLIFAVGLIIILIISTIVQNKKRKTQMADEERRMSKLCQGTTILTRGGIMGTVESVDDEENSFILNTAGTLMKFDKRAIYQMTLPESVQKELEAELAQEAEKKGKKA